MYEWVWGMRLVWGDWVGLGFKEESENFKKLLGDK